MSVLCLHTDFLITNGQSLVSKLCKHWEIFSSWKCCLWGNKQEPFSNLAVNLVHYLEIGQLPQRHQVQMETDKISLVTSTSLWPPSGASDSRAAFGWKALLARGMGRESQLHGPSAVSYQGKGAAFGQINPLLRSLLKARWFSCETI